MSVDEKTPTDCHQCVFDMTYPERGSCPAGRDPFSPGDGSFSALIAGPGMVSVSVARALLCFMPVLPYCPARLFVSVARTPLGSLPVSPSS